MSRHGGAPSIGAVRMGRMPAERTTKTPAVPCARCGRETRVAHKRAEDTMCKDCQWVDKRFGQWNFDSITPISDEENSTEDS